MKYKGFTITHDSSGAWIVSNEAGNVQSCSTLKNAQEWITANPLEDFVAIFLLGEKPCEIFGWEGADAVGKFLAEECYCEEQLVRRVFITKAEQRAYCQAIEDLDGHSMANYINEKEYKQILKYLE